MIRLSGYDGEGMSGVVKKDKIDGKEQTDKGRKMIPMQLLAAEENYCEHCKYYQRDSFLDNFELHQREGTSVTLKAHPVGRYLAGVFEQSYPPGDEYDDVKRRV